MLSALSGARRALRSMHGPFLSSALFLALCTAFAAYLLLSGSPEARATSHVLTELEGYAWSDNIGWISMNCSNEANCSADGGNDYKVEVHDDFTLNGYGWSDNIGWVKFGGNVDGCQGGGNCDARVNTDTNELEGWARACAGTQSGDCSSMTSRTDGWDGWISLNCDNTGDCTNSDYAIDVQTGGFAACNSTTGSCAWGSDVVGWTDWSGVYFTPPCTPGPVSCTADNSGVITTNQWCEQETTACTAPAVCDDSTLTCDVPANPTLDEFDADPRVVRSGETSTVTWSVSDASDCTVEGGNDSWTGTSGTEETSPIVGQVEYVLECTSLDGSSTQELGRLTIVTIPVVEEN